METRTVEQVTQWDSRPVSSGLAGLRDLADEEFSGALEAGGTWAFVLNGRVVGVFEGELEDFENQTVTAYRTPDQALPLLFAMREQGGQTQAKYYTNETPLSDAHDTLTGANFSGYVELSENVLSGDYYVVYYGGRSMSAAYVGESERLITGDEAFERADDEVGIYEVRKVDLDVIDLKEVAGEPEPEPDPEPVAEPEPEPATESETEPEPEPEPSQESEQAPDPTPDPSTDRTTDSDDRSGGAPAETPQSETGPGSEPEPSPGTPKSDPQSDQQRAESRSARQPTSRSESSSAGTAEPESLAGGSSQATNGASSSTDAETQREDVFDEEQQWRQAKAIPSLDPDRSSDRARKRPRKTKRSRTGSAGGAVTAETESKPSKSKPNESKPAETGSKPAPAESEPDDGSVDPPTAAEFEEALEESKREIERLNERLSKAESEQQELLAQREDLRSEIQRLTSELEAARAAEGNAGDANAPAGRSLPADQALEGTNLFVRYASKSEATLADAREGADREAVNENLSLEHHTQFEADEVVVDGQAYDDFLRESIQYRFVRWLVEDLLYEIRDTGHVGELRELFDALPKVDRAELDGTATVRKTEDGEEVRTQRTFDIVLRDRMGNPLLVANINDARDPATGDMMADLVAAANDVGETSDSLSAAVFVTASFFEPAALETAAEATSGGLLSREKKESFVKLSRKRGYHLCLVETRAGQFHVNVPEL